MKLTSAVVVACVLALSVTGAQAQADGHARSVGGSGETAYGGMDMRLNETSASEVTASTPFQRAFSFAALTADPPVEEQCANAIKIGEPACQHGGTLVADNTTVAINCASCNCPDGWSGADCALCTRVESCPAIPGGDSDNEGAGVQGLRRALSPSKRATGCSSDSVAPFPEEVRNGKLLRCECGGDAMTDSYCSYQPGTNWHFNVTGDSLELKEFAGMASMNLAPAGDPDHYKYLFPGVFTGSWGGCRWYQSNCTDHPAGPCVMLECDSAGDVDCPPSGIEKCPGFSQTSCGKDPSGTQPYLQHHCLAVPSSKPVQLACPTTRNATTGSYHCFFKQEGGLITNLGMMCKTGGCLYDGSTPPAPLPPKPHAALSATPAIVLTCIGSVYALFLIIVIGLVVIELRSKDSLQSCTCDDEVDEMEGTCGGGGGDSGGNELTKGLLADELEDARSRRDQRGTASVSFESITYRLPTGRRNTARRAVLSGIDGIAGQGPNAIAAGGADDSGIFAVLGPSGAGKTSLLEILSGHPMPGQVDGCVRVNGRAVRFDSMRRIAGFVPQEVVLPGTSTVWEYLMFHATLRLPPALRARDRRRIIADIIRELGLQRVQDSIIGNEFIRGLSGGERRRVSVAAELITRPAILMLDEPTTGLDSTNAAKMVDILTGLVHAGVTVLISIHQPRADVFRMLTRVLILSGEGTTVYSGPTRLAAAHFEGLGYSQRDEGAVDVGGGSSLHIADYVLDLVIRSSHDEVDRMVQGYLSSEVAAKERQCLAADEAAILSGDVASPSGDSLSTSSFPDSKYISPFRRQFALLVSRHVQKIYRNPFVTVINVFGYLLMAVFIGTVFYDTDVDSGGIQDRMGSQFFIMMYMALTCLTVIPIWMEEYMVLFRENHSMVYSVEAYFLSVVLIDLLLMRILPTSFFALPYVMIGLGGGSVSRGAIFVGLLVLINTSFSALCMAIGASTRSGAVANFVGSFILQLLLLSSGFLVNGTALPGYLRAVVDVLMAKNGYEALLANEFAGKGRQYFFTSHADPDLRVAVSGDKVLTTFGYRPDEMPTNVAIVCVSCAAFYVAAFVLLKAKTLKL